MPKEFFLLLAADGILVAHVLFVCFVVFGLIAIFLGYFLNWQWVRNFSFRVIHMLGIGIVVLQSWLGIVCPLTVLEMVLREKAGEVTYTGSFIHYWLQAILYFDAPEWFFILLYTFFGVLVLFSWLIVRPNPFRKSK